MHKFLDKASKAYYEGNPLISDEEFDYLAELSSYQKLGSRPTTRSGTISHFTRLYSLNKFYETDELPLQSEELIESPKLDGSAVSLLYIEGSLAKAATRGDGFIGEDISGNLIGWERIPQTLHGCTDRILQVVGEIIAPKDIPNSRNYAAGATRLKSREEFIDREVYFIAYAMSVSNKNLGAYPTYEKDMELLSSFGFRTVLDPELTEVFPTDGVVFRVNRNQRYQELGFTDKHPRGAFALKTSKEFETKRTKLLKVTWQVGKSGKVTPVAHFEPIVLNDANISKATLHNAGFIEDMDLSIGDTLIVTRAGGIIPKVLGVDR